MSNSNMELPLLLRGIFETIPDAMNRMQPFRAAGIVADLGAQVFDVRVNSALVAFEIVAENLLYELHARVHMTGIAATW